MIANEQEYQITKGWVERFEGDLARADEQGANLHPRLKQAMRESIESELEVLREQIAEYEARRVVEVGAAPLRRPRRRPAGEPAEQPVPSGGGGGRECPGEGRPLNKPRSSRKCPSGHK